MADLNFYYNQQLNSWVAMDITKVDATTMHNMMKTGNPYGYNSGVPSSQNLYFNNADAVNDFGHGVSLTDFDAYKKFNFNNPVVKNLANGSYTFQQLKDMGIFVGGDTGDNIITSSMYGFTGLSSAKWALGNLLFGDTGSYVRGAYVHGSMQFELLNDTRFVKNGNILTVQGEIGVAQKVDNFDFKSDKIPNWLNNGLKWFSGTDANGRKYNKIMLYGQGDGVFIEAKQYQYEDQISVYDFSNATQGEYVSGGLKDVIVDLSDCNSVQLNTFLNTSGMDIECFRVGTAILLPNNVVKPIQDIKIGDMVMAFDGLGLLTACKVLGLKRGTTHEWVKLSYNDTVLYATKNHEFLSIDGDFKSLQNLMNHTNNNQIHIIDENANIISANYEIINVDADTTYNFEVEGLHTYIAGGIRVHNDCGQGMIYADDFDRFSQADLNRLKSMTLHKSTGLTLADATGYKADYVNINSVNNIAGGVNIESDSLVEQIGGEVYYVFEQGAKITIDAVEYTAEAVVQAGNNAYNALSNFVSGNFKDTILPDVIGGAFNQTLADIGAMVAGGQTLDAEKIMKAMAKRIGYNFISQSFIQTQAMNELTIKLNGGTINNIGGKNYMSLRGGGDIAIDAKRTALPDGGYTYTGYNSKGEKITITENQTMLGGYGGAVLSGLITFGVQAGLGSQGWNSDDYIRNGTITVGTTVAQYALSDALSEPLGGNAAGGVAAAATTMIAGIISNPDMDSGEWTRLTAQAGIAGGSVYAGAAIASAFSLGSSTSVLWGLAMINPAALVIGAVLGVVLSTVMSKAFGSVKMGPTDSQNRNEAEDRLWRFAHITQKLPDGTKKTVDAIYSFNADGQTLNYADIVGRDNFRVIENADFEAGKFDNPTLLNKGEFNPTYYVGVGKTSTSLGADNIVASGLNDTIIGNTGSDYLDAKGGSNTIFGDGNVETANDGNDVILAGAVDKNGNALTSNNIISAGGGDDYVSVTGKGNNTIMLGSGHDRAYTADSNDVIVGGSGEDYIEAGHGNNNITLGNTTYDITSEAIKSDDDTSENEVYTGHGNDIISGSAGNDIIVSDVMTEISKAVILENKQDNYRTDSISAGSGNDLIMAGLGNDTVYGDAGDDVIIGGGAGDDVIIGGGAGDDIIGAGTQLSDGTFVNDVSVTAFLDNDLDQIWGGAGNDIIIADTIIDGTDQYSVNTLLSDSNVGDTNNYLSGTQTVTQQKGAIENDYVDGGIGNDFIYAGGGNDQVVGGLGSDIIFGGYGNDNISGDEGVDYIIGDMGNDTLDGGLSDDFYFFRNFSGTDTIKNIQNRDRIVFAENSFAELVFKRIKNNLEITNGGGTKVIIENHFAGNGAFCLYDKQNKVYSLRGLTGNSGDIVNPVQSTGTWTNPVTTLNTLSQEHEQNFADATSPFAVNESSSWYEQNYYTEAKRSIESETINGVQVGFTKRKRSPWGGHYNVFYQIKNQNLVGTVQQDTTDPIPLIIDELGIQTDIQLNINQLNTADLGNGDKVQVYSVDGEYLFADYANWGKTLESNINIYDNQKKGIVYEYTVGVTDQFNDLIVGAYWDEMINAYGGDDIIFGGLGVDKIYGNDGNDFVNGGDGNDILHGDIADGIVTYNYADEYTMNRLLYRVNDEWYLKDDYGTVHIVETNHDLLFGGTGDDLIYGELGNDTLNGDSGNDTIDGGTGDDYAEGNSGNDIIQDLIGDAIIDGGSGNDTITTGNGFDLVRGGSGIDIIKAGGANDTVFGGDNSDTLYGETGHDLIYGGYGHDFINGDNGNDILIGGYGDDMFFGGLDNDKSYGGSGRDIFYGDAGSDMYHGGSGTDTMSYYYSTDAGVIIDFAAGKTDSQNLDSAANSRGDSYFSIENIIGTKFNDIIYGNDTNNFLFGMEGNDRLYGNEGDDRLIGGLGRNYLLGRDGNDSASYQDTLEGITVNLQERKSYLTSNVSLGIVLDSFDSIESVVGSKYKDSIIGDDNGNILWGLEGDDKLYGFAGDDHFISGLGVDYISGGLGRDKIDYSDSTEVIKVCIKSFDVTKPIYGFGGTASGDYFNSIEDVIGSNYNDEIIGNDSDNTLYGGRGNDTFIGHLGADTFDGYTGIDTVSYRYATAAVNVDFSKSTGYSGEATGDIFKSIENFIGSEYDDIFKGNHSNNVIYSSLGSDSVNGHSGFDDINYSNSTSGVSVVLDGVTAGKNGYAAGDILISIENINGSNHDDILTGGTDNNILVGGGGNDTVRGGIGLDSLYGGTGNDSLFGDDDNDSVYGDAGNDVISGGNGSDTMIYTSSTAGINIRLDGTAGTGGDALGDKLYSIENIYGSGYDDSIVGTNGDNYIRGYNGIDRILGLDGNDKILGGKGADFINGGNGIDTVSYTDSYAAVIARLNDETTETSAQSNIGGTAQDDKIIYVECLDGSKYDDTLYGNLQNNTLSGQAGDDTIFGYAGADTFYGDLGADTLSGGSNSDSFVYNSINDSLNSSFDIITDFQTGYDKIVLNFDVNIADILITTASGYKNISITDTDFFIRINNNITLNDIALI